MPDIITELYRSAEVRDCLNRHFDHHCREDVKQDLFELLINLAPGTLEEKQSRGKLRQYVATIIINLKNQKYGKIAKMVKQYQFSNPLPENIEQVEIDYDNTNELVLERFEKIDWYKRTIIDFYIKLGTVKAVAEFTQIPYESVKYAITQARKEIRKEW
jgi:DNA-directed RNA polymerase specialized sigma24 family protein